MQQILKNNFLKNLFTVFLITISLLQQINCQKSVENQENSQKTVDQTTENQNQNQQSDYEAKDIESNKYNNSGKEQTSGELTLFYILILVFCLIVLLVFIVSCYSFFSDRNFKISPETIAAQIQKENKNKQQQQNKKSGQKQNQEPKIVFPDFLTNSVQKEIQDKYNFEIISPVKLRNDQNLGKNCKKLNFLEVINECTSEQNKQKKRKRNGGQRRSMEDIDLDNLKVLEPVKNNIKEKNEEQGVNNESQQHQDTLILNINDYNDIHQEINIQQQFDILSKQNKNKQSTVTANEKSSQNIINVYSTSEDNTKQLQTTTMNTKTMTNSNIQNNTISNNINNNDNDNNNFQEQHVNSKNIEQIQNSNQKNKNKSILHGLFQNLQFLSPIKKQSNKKKQSSIKKQQQHSNNKTYENLEEDDNKSTIPNTNNQISLFQNQRYNKQQQYTENVTPRLTQNNNNKQSNIENSFVSQSLQEIVDHANKIEQQQKQNVDKQLKFIK